MKKVKPIFISVVIPCLNEEKGVGICVKKSIKIFKEHGWNGEVIVVDNGSTDKTAQVASKAGARVVHEKKKGYGNAYLRGFSEAKGTYVIMADGDNTYDFLDIPKFIEKLEQGTELVMGSRLRGLVKKGAMPLAHRYIGSPILTFLLNLVSGAYVSDAQCGMRGFKRTAIQKLAFKTGGMEFASEMIIRAAQAKLKITEIPITYHIRKGESKLSPIKDAWRNIRFMMLLSPLNLFLYSGITLFILGLLILSILLPGSLTLGAYTIHYHPMFLGSLLVILGYQIVSLGLFSHVYAVTTFGEKLHPQLAKIYNQYKLEKGLSIGALLLFIGLMGVAWVFAEWIQAGYHNIFEVRLSLFSLTIIILGFQTIFSSLYLSILGIEKN